MAADPPGITDYGAFIELENGIEGLIHISEMSWSQHIKHPSQLLHVGEDVEAKILNIESDEKKISLGLKQLEPDPWEHIDDKYPLNSKHTGVVRNLTQFGAFVELEEGIDGLVHISDLSWTKKVRHPSEVVKKADEIDVVVLGINRDERRIALGHKQIDENPWDAFEEKYKVDTDTTGTISRIIDKGLIVTLPLGVDGFIPITHLGPSKLKKAIEYYKEGDEVPAKVIEFDKENKKILSAIKKTSREPHIHHPASKIELPTLHAIRHTLYEITDTLHLTIHSPQSYIQSQNKRYHINITHINIIHTNITHTITLPKYLRYYCIIYINIQIVCWIIVNPLPKYLRY